MTASTHETQIAADPDVPLIRITREFDAPPSKVFRAHTDPDLVVQWLGPRGLEMRIDHYDCRTGGSLRHLDTDGHREDAFPPGLPKGPPDTRSAPTFPLAGMARRGAPGKAGL